jgi:hypothetical protein
VVSVSDYERERAQKLDHVKFAQFNYLTMIDNTSNKTITCKVYTNSRKSTQDRIRVGQIVCLTDMRLLSVTADSLVANRKIFLMSTPSTSIFLEHEQLSKKSIKNIMNTSTLKTLTRFRDERLDEIDPLMRNNPRYNLPFIDVPSYSIYESIFPDYPLVFFK